MDIKKTSWTNRAIFTIICCAYFSITGLLVDILSQPSLMASKMSTGLSIPEENRDAMDKASDTLDKIDITSLTERGKAAEEILHPIITEVATEHEIDPDLIKAIIWAESSFNPNAISNKGAQGLMQLMPATARSLGVEDSMNPESNIDGGVRYFKQLMVQFDGDEKLALAAYNAGSRKVREYNGIPPFESTQFYVKKVFEYYQEFKDEVPPDIDKI